jgi:Spy/CpxP family protein refolding chaperone
MASTLVQAAITAGLAAGAVSVPGLVIGDVMVSLVFDTTTAPHGKGPVMSLGMFEGVVSVNDQIQQLKESTVDGIVYNAVFARFS